MAIDQAERTQLVIEQLTKLQDRLILFLAFGFVVGFIVGLVAAWTVAR